MIRIVYVSLMVGLLSLSGFSAGVVFDIVPLDLLGSNESKAWRINDSLQILGTSFWDLNNDPTDGVTHAITHPYVYASCIDMNAHALAAGDYSPRYLTGHEMGGTRPCLYDAVTGTWTDLGTLADDNEGDPYLYDGHPWDGYNNLYWYDGWATGINNHNQIVGVSCMPDVHDAGCLPVLWNSPGNLIPLSTTPMSGWTKFDINDNGDIAGTTDDGWNLRAVRGSAQSGLTPLPIPAGYTSRSVAYKINEQGVIVGYVQYSADPIIWHGAKWDAQGNVEILEPKIEIAMSINERGQIVGVSLDGDPVLLDGHQIYDINRCAYQTGWEIIRVEDINNDGTIIGWGEERSTGRTVPLMLRARLDEAKPLAEYNDNSMPTGGTNPFEIIVTYLDDGMLDSSSLDNNDIRVTGPNGFNSLAVFDHVDDGEFRQGLRTWQACYLLAAPGGSWDQADIGTYTISLESNQVRDMSGRNADAGTLGTFAFSESPIKIKLSKGIVYGPGPTVTYRFSCRADVSYFENNGYTVTSLRLCSPANVWYPLSKTSEGWVYEKSGGSPSDTSVFGDGTYQIETVIPFDGSPFTMTDNLVFAIPGTSNPLPQPTQQPSFVYPTSNAPAVESPLTVEWAPVTDSAVNGIELSIRDTDDDRILLDQIIPNPTRTTFGPLWLTPEHHQTASVILRHGCDNQFVNFWSCSVNKYTENRIAFTAAPADPDINGDAEVNLFDMFAVQNHWLLEDCSAENQWCLRADFNRDGTVDILDLLILAEQWLQP